MSRPKFLTPSGIENRCRSCGVMGMLSLETHTMKCAHCGRTEDLNGLLSLSKLISFSLEKGLGFLLRGHEIPSWILFLVMVGLVWACPYIFMIPVALWLYSLFFIRFHPGINFWLFLFGYAPMLPLLFMSAMLTSHWWACLWCVMTGFWMACLPHAR